MDLTPPMLTLALANWVIGLLTVGFLFCSVLLILTVLIQRPQGGGLSGAFGAGAGSGETAFGARTGDALTIATISFFVIWLLVAIGLVWTMQPGAGPLGPAQVTSTEEPQGPQGTPAPPAEGAAPADEQQPPAETPAPEGEAPGGQAPAEQTPPGGGGEPTGPGDGAGEQGAGD